MRILIIGAGGTIGKKLTPVLAEKHEIVTAGRNSGEHRLDVASAESIRNLFESQPAFDACICIAASGPLDNFTTLREAQLKNDLHAKLFGQINLVLIGQHYLNSGGSFTITSGIFADIPYKGVTGGAIASGALHSFTLSAALELPRGLRINVVSPGMVEDSAEKYGHLFPGLKAVCMENIVEAFVSSIEQSMTGQILRVY